MLISGKMADCPPLKKQKGGVCRIGDPFWGVLGFDLQRRGICLVLQKSHIVGTTSSIKSMTSSNGANIGMHETAELERT